MELALLGDLDMYEAYRAESLAPPDAKLVPNLSNVYEQFRTAYSIPHIFSAMVIVYNKEKFELPPESFKIAMDPAYKGRVGFSDILFNFNTLFVGLAGGGSANSFDPGMEVSDRVEKERAQGISVQRSRGGRIQVGGDLDGVHVEGARSAMARCGPAGRLRDSPRRARFRSRSRAPCPRTAATRRRPGSMPTHCSTPRASCSSRGAMGYAPTVRNAGLPAELQARVGFTDEELKRIHKYDLKVLYETKNACLDFWNKSFKRQVQ